MAIDPETDNLLGVAINVEAKREKSKQTLEECLAEYDDPRFKHIMAVLYKVNEKAGDLYREAATRENMVKLCVIMQTNLDFEWS